MSARGSKESSGARAARSRKKVRKKVVLARAKGPFRVVLDCILKVMDSIRGSKLGSGIIFYCAEICFMNYFLLRNVLGGLMRETMILKKLDTFG